MVGGGDTLLPSYINPDDLVEGVLEAVAQHRENTRQVLSSDCDDIASSYFASQFGTSNQQQQKTVSSNFNSKTNSRTNSRRNSFSTKPSPVTACNNNLVQSTMASAAAKIAKLKQQEREEQRQKFKEQSVQQQQFTQQQQSVQQQQFTQQQQSVQQQQFTQQQQSVQQQQFVQQQNTQQQYQQQQNYQQVNQDQDYQQQAYHQQQMIQNQKMTEEEKQRSQAAGSRRGSQQFSYLSLLPEDGSFPHRTQPIGEPQTKRTNSTAPSPARELGRKPSFHGSSEYLHATPNTNYACRSNPIGLAEPSLGRDGYSVGKDGSLFRSTGNLNVAGGNSRAGSVNREINNSWKGERRSSSTDVKGCGIRTGGNLIEPSSKPPPSFNMPFGSGANRTVNYKKSRTHKTTSKRERNKSLSGDNRSLAELSHSEEHSTMNVTVSRPKGRAQSMPRGEVNQCETSYTLSLPPSRNTSRQPSVEPESRRVLSRHGSVEIFDAGYKMTIPNKMSKYASQTKLEEIQADHYFFPGKEVVETVTPKVKPSVQCIGVEVKHSDGKVEKVSEQSSEIKEELSNLTNQITNYTTASSMATSVSETCQSYQSMQSSSEYKEHSSYEESICSSQTIESTQQSMQYNQQSMESAQSIQNCTQSSQQSTQYSQQSSQSTQKSVQSINQSNQYNQQSTQNNVQHNQQSTQNNVQYNQQSTQNKSRSRNPSGGNATIVQGHKFNIENALKRNSRTCSTENIAKSSQITNTSTSTESGSMLKQLDVALQQYAHQQQKQQAEQVHYVAKVQSRTTSRRNSISVNGEEEVTNITVSLPSSRNQSRNHSRRGSVEPCGKRSSRRNSLDVYTAEYAIKLAKDVSDKNKNNTNTNAANKENNNKYKIDTLEQKSAFHIKVANEADSGLNLCGRCHLPTHKTADCTEYAESVCPCCLSWDHWIDSCPIQLNEYVCTSCNYIGHLEDVHQASKYKQRRTCIDLLGWEPFQLWFYEPDFRNWWQVTGCCGVPLYKIYPRKTQWRKERKPEPEGGNPLSKGDSVDDLIASVLKQRKSRPPPKSDDESSGRSSPDIRGPAAEAAKMTADDIDLSENGESLPRRKARTFSATLRSLDQDILAELDL